MHLYPEADATAPLCGATGHPLPKVLVDHAQAHIDGHNAVVCPDCWTAWKGDIPQPIPGQIDLFEGIA